MRDLLLLRVAVTTFALGACTSVELVRLRTGPPRVGDTRAQDVLVGVQTSCLGFYVGTIGIPTCDLDRVLNELLHGAAKQIGAERLLELRLEGTPDSGIWWLTKLLWFRSARASALAVVAMPPRGPPSRRAHPASVPASRPARLGRARSHSSPSREDETLEPP